MDNIGAGGKVEAAYEALLDKVGAEQTAQTQAAYRTYAGDPEALGQALAQVDAAVEGMIPRYAEFATEYLRQNGSNSE